MITSATVTAVAAVVSAGRRRRWIHLANRSDSTIFVKYDGSDTALTAANGTYRIKTTGDGQHFQLKNATTGLWHTAFLTGAEGAVTLAFGAGEA